MAPMISGLASLTQPGATDVAASLTFAVVGGWLLIALLIKASDSFNRGRPRRAPKPHASRPSPRRHDPVGR